MEHEKIQAIVREVATALQQYDKVWEDCDVFMREVDGYSGSSSSDPLAQLVKIIVTFERVYK